MKRVNLLAIVAISFGLTIMNSSCKNENSVGTVASLTATALDETQVSNVSDEVISSADDYVNDIDLSGYQAVGSIDNSNPQKIGFFRNINGVIVTVDKAGNIYPKTITVDFGTSGITGKRGNILKGVIIIVVSNRMNIENSTRTFTFSDFFVNDNAVLGSKTVTYNGETAGKPSWTIVAKDTVVRADGTKVIWNSNRTRTRIDNNSTPLIYWDDLYSISGGSNGVNAKGVAYTKTINETNPLIVAGGYPFFTQGSVLITSENKTVLVDYGDGTKDNKATVTIDGVTKEITLKK